MAALRCLGKLLEKSTPDSENFNDFQILSPRGEFFGDSRMTSEKKNLPTKILDHCMIIVSAGVAELVRQLVRLIF